VTDRAELRAPWLVWDGPEIHCTRCGMRVPIPTPWPPLNPMIAFFEVLVRDHEDCREGTFDREEPGR
jgi:hypothetical protein